MELVIPECFSWNGSLEIDNEDMDITLADQVHPGVVDGILILNTSAQMWENRFDSCNALGHKGRVVMSSIVKSWFANQKETFLKI